MTKNYLLILAVLFFSIIPCTARDIKGIEQKLRAELSKSDNAQDSIRVLYDLFDVSPRAEKIDYARRIYNIAERHNLDNVRLDILRQVVQLTGVINNRDSAFKALNAEVERIPQSREQEETALFIQMRQVAHEARTLPQKEVQEKVVELISEESKAKSMSINQRVLRLFTIVEYLSNNVQGDLLNEYVGMLHERLQQADFQIYALENIMYTEAANIYTAVDNQEAAVASDKKLLKVIDALKKKYHNMGREYRDYIPNYHIIYRRLLSNYEALTPQEIEEYYSKIQEMMSDPDVRSTVEQRPLSKMFYAMSHKDYETAIPIILKELEGEKGLTRRRRLVTWLQEAAVGTGNKELEMQALRDMNQILLEREEYNTMANFRDLAIRTKVNELQAEKERMKYEQQELKESDNKRLMTFVIFSWVLFALMLVLFLFYWGRFRTANIRIGNFVNKLDEEREYLKRTIYKGDGGEKDPVKDSRQDVKEVPVRRRDNRITSRFEYILNDLLYLSSVGRSTRDKYQCPVNIRQLAGDEVTRAKATMPGNVKMAYKEPATDLTVVTDKECLEYVLRHIFHAAQRTSRGGTISLEVREDPATNQVHFIFVNSSVTVPEGHEEMMFDEFISFEPLYRRADAGLFLVRLSSFLLDSSIRLDKNFTEGSSYIFSIKK